MVNWKTNMQKVEKKLIIKKKKNFLQHFEEERRNRDLNERRKFQVFNIKTI
jgi:hypothetical protein